MSEAFAIARSRAGEGHLPLARQCAEMAMLLLRRGVGPNLYLQAGFWRRDVPWSEKLKLFGPSEYQRRLDLLNPPEYRKISQNKLSEKALLEQFAIPTPRFIGYFDAHRGRSRDGTPLKTPGDLTRVLAPLAGRRICFKELEGWEGRNFTAVEIIDRAGSIELRHLLEERSHPVEVFCRERLHVAESGWLMEGYIEQHPWYAALNPSSVNSFRIWAIRDRGERGRVIAALLRAGRAGFLVDNQHETGRIIAPIDLATGRLHAPIDGLPTRREYPVHPDTGRQMAGEVPPQFDEVKAVALNALEVFPKMRFAGLDVAMSTTGPLVLELNVVPDFNAAAYCNIPVRDVFLP